jgi:2-polyprenyl-3-methyl-5-hydroxy-6-metoxy-1,4-benzoquinol methylase
MVQEMLSVLRDGTILDAGAGSGEVTIPLLEKGNNILFMDSSQGMLDLAMRNVPERYRNNVRAVRASVMDFSTDDRFDAVICIGVLAHISGWKSALGRLASWVAPDGALVVQLTDHAAMLGRLTHQFGRASAGLLNRATHQHQRMTLREVEQTLSALGFSLSESRRHSFIPGLRVMPERWAAAVVRSSSEGPFASRHGGEVIAAFRR